MGTTTSIAINPNGFTTNSALTEALHRWHIPLTSIFCDGRWVTPSEEALIDPIAIINPATETCIAHVPNVTNNDINAVCQSARNALSRWRKTSLDTRLGIMTRMLEYLRAMRESLIAVEVTELGAPIQFTRKTHVDLQYRRIETFCSLAHRALEPEVLTGATVYRHPIGVVAAITPWNYPLGQLIQKVIPALLMGNTVIIKPSSLTPISAYFLIEAFRLAELPAGVLNLITGTGSRVGEILANHPMIDMVSFTGSTTVGQKIGTQATQHLKRITLELGGKSAYIWLPSSDYSGALPKLISSIFYNSGQTCTSLSRLIVPRCDLSKIEALVTRAAECLRVGNPWDETTDLGPVASKAQFDRIAHAIANGQTQGARLLTGGTLNQSPGYWIAPTIFSDIQPTMDLAQEEIFGPVLSILSYDTIDEAIALANHSRYGLSAAVFGPKELALDVARQLETGNVFINGAPRDLAAPMGGFKYSGIGVEGGLWGLWAFTQQQSIFGA